MKNVWLISCLLVALTGCRKDDVEAQNACTAAKPLEDVRWLKQMKDELNCSPLYQYSIVKAMYRGQTVFFVHFSCPNCDYIFRATLLDCSGKTVRTFTSTVADMEAFSKEVTDWQPLYTC